MCLREYPDLEGLTPRELILWLWPRRNKMTVSRRERYNTMKAYVEQMCHLKAFDTCAATFAMHEFGVSADSLKRFCRRSPACSLWEFRRVFG